MNGSRVWLYKYTVFKSNGKLFVSQRNRGRWRMRRGSVSTQIWVPNCRNRGRPTTRRDPQLRKLTLRCGFSQFIQEAHQGQWRVFMNVKRSQASTNIWPITIIFFMYNLFFVSVCEKRPALWTWLSLQSGCMGAFQSSAHTPQIRACSPATPRRCKLCSDGLSHAVFYLEVFCVYIEHTVTTTPI